MPAVASAADVVAALSAGSFEVVLVDEGLPVAYVDRGALASVPPHALAQTPAWSVAAPLHPGAAVDADLRGTDLLTALVAAFRVQPVVVALAEGRVVALLVDGDVARSLR